MSRTFWLVVVCAGIAVALAGGVTAAKQKPFPDVIQLPTGFRPEGIEVKGPTFYVGSVATGALWLLPGCPATSSTALGSPTSLIREKSAVWLKFATPACTV